MDLKKLKKRFLDNDCNNVPTHFEAFVLKCARNANLKTKHQSPFAKTANSNAVSTSV